MEDLDVLARDFGVGTRGKSNPMRSDTGDRRSSSVRFASSSSPLFDDHNSNNESVLFNDVFGRPPNHTVPSASKSASVDDFDYDSIFKSSTTAAKDFKSSKESTGRASSLPVYDKPVYDDDMFDGLPGQRSKSPSSGRFDDYVFVSMESPSEQRKNSSSVQFDDLLGKLAKNDRSDMKNSESEGFDDLLGNLETTDVNGRSSTRSSSARGLDDLLGGFGSGSSVVGNRSAPDTTHGQKPAGITSQSTSRMMDDPFVVLETTSPPIFSPKAVFTDPLEEIGKLGKSRNGETDASSVSGGVFDDLDPLNSYRRSAVPSPDLSSRGNDMSPSRSGPSISGPQTPAYSEHVGKSSSNISNSHSQTRIQDDNFQQSPVFEIHHRSFHANSSSPSHVNANDNETNFRGGISPQSEEHLHPSDELWLSVSEIPLFTQPTRAPPPSRPPPPIPRRNTKSEPSVFPSDFRKRGDDFASPPSYEPYSQIPKRPAANSTSFSQIDELEDFATGTTKNTVEEAKIPSGEEMNASSVAADAMKEAMDRAEVKFRHAKEVREREYAKATKLKEAAHVDQDDEASQDAKEREIYENQKRVERERRQREEEASEQRRLERERERAKETERERGRQAVERATREARERAAAEARVKAERAAVGKVQNEARERAERAAVLRAQAEARERAAAEARERQEKAAAEAKEKAAAEASYKEAREKAAAEKATAEARRRAERAAVERAAAEARERAAAEARERAAAAARANQQKNGNDVESFFHMDSRPNSAPRSRGNSSDPIFDPPPSRGPGGSQGPKTTHAGSPSNIPKAFSTTNIVDDLSSIFGVDAPFGQFQEVEGETEERRKARLDRTQRTQERAANALAEKNQRDLQAQREQEERHRFAESLDIEIKRWSAGKEGNLRALLSTLQYVLWPECGWQPVSLTDLIVGSNVKKVYRKATLCIHPDKVQQKGATLQQKYIAEKVFDLLKVPLLNGQKFPLLPVSG